MERIWKISSIIWNCGFCDFCVISIILLYFIDFKFLSKWLWIFMEEVIYNYKTCDWWWQNRRNFMFRSHKKFFWLYKASFSVIWILLQYRGRNWSSLNFISGEGCHSSPFLSSLKHELVNDLDIHNRRILLMNVIITLIISILFIIGIILLIMGLIKLIKK